MQPEVKLSCIWRKYDTEESFDQKYYWNKIFIASCMCALFVDPLFLYVPILKDDFKCLMLDPKLKIVVLLLRSLTDLFYLMDIIIRIYRFENYSGSIVQLNRRQHQMDFSFVLKSCIPRIVKTIWASNDILIDIVALLPFPQVAVLIFFSKMSDLRSLTPIRMVLTNIFALLQYVPRVFRIYLSSKELKRNLEEEITETPIWIKGVLNFCMYIIASHVFGAVWYFFAIQRMMICWHFACRKDDGCDNRIFGCHDHHAFRNTTILNDLCPVSVSSSNTMLFDFGIFAIVLQYGIVGSTNYFKKFLNCFWWGLRNLSSLGSNLEPSADGWENLYTIFISITGLLLFLYLIGNLQMYMQLESTRTDNRMQIRRRMKGKDKEIELWLFKKGIPTRLIKDFKLQILEKVKQAVQEDTDTNLDNILPLLPSDVQTCIKVKEPFAKLKQVPMLQGIDEDVLKIICQKLEPKRYTENSDIIQKDKPLDEILYIVDGDVSIEEGSSDDSRRGAGQLCGEELLRWPFYSYFPHRNPSATEFVKAIGVVEALALNASDLQSIYMQSDSLEKEKPRHRRMVKEEIERNIDGLIRRNGIPERLNQDVKSRIMKNVEERFQQDDHYWDLLDWDHLFHCLPRDFQDEIKIYMPVTQLEKVPILRGMDEDVLKIICQKLEPVRYTENSDIIQKDKPLEEILYIVDGDVSIEEGSSDDSRRGAGQLCGEELLRWPFYSYFPHRKLLATKSVKAIGVVEALVLNAQDLQSIYDQSYIAGKEASRHRRMMKEEMETNIDGLIRRKEIPERFNEDVKSRIMKKIQQFQKDDLYWDDLDGDDLDWDHLVSHLPLDFQNEIKRCMALTKLKKVPMLRGIDEDVLKIICQKLEPVRYTENRDIIQKDKPLDEILYIVDGDVSIEEGSSDDSRRGAGQLCGEELLRWPFYSYFPHRKPLATESVKAIGVVEALALNAQDLRSIYDQSDIARKEASRHRRMMKAEMETNIDGLIHRKEIPERFNQDVKSRIMEKMEQFQKDDLYWDELDGDELDWDHLVSHLPLDFQNEIKRCMALTKLKKVPMLREIDEDVLKIICQKLEPVRYNENRDIIQKDKPLDEILYIVDGDVSIEEGSSDDSRRGAGQLCGEELLRWPFYSYFPHRKPLATESVKAIDVVEALALNAQDLRSIYNQSDIARKEASRHRRMMKEEMETNIDGLIRRKEIPERFNEDVKSRIMEKIEQFQKDDLYWDDLDGDELDWDHLVSHLPLDFQNEIKRCMALTKLKKVPMLQGIDEDVLKIICQKLEPVRYTENRDIIQKDKPLDKILYIVDGDVSIEEGSSDDSRRGAGQLCGEQLLRWPFYSYFPHRKPLATESVKAIGVVEALALNAQDLRSIYDQSDIARKEASRHRRMMKEEMETNIDGLICRKEIPERFNQDVKSRIMEKIEQFQKDDLYWDDLDGDDLDWDHLVSHLPLDFQNEIKRCMALTKLKKVPMLRGIDEDVFEVICQKLEPVRYTENSDIIQKDTPLDEILYIVDGDVSIEEGSSDDSRRGAGQLCGEQLLRWPFYSYFPHIKPLATESVKAIGVVEALALNSQDFRSIYRQLYIFEKEKPRHRRMMKEEIEQNIDGWIRRNRIPERLNLDLKSRIMKNIEENFQQDDLYWDLLDWDHLVHCLPRDFQNEIERYMPVTKLKKVPMLRGIDEDVLERLCQKLEPVRYAENNFIIQKGERLDKMVYIVDGFVSIEERSSDDSRRGAGELFGEELLRLPFSTDFPFTRPLATESVKAIGVVEALALEKWALESMYLEPDIRRKEEPRHKRMMKEEIERNIDGFVRRNGIPEWLNQDLKLLIMENVEEKLQQDDLNWDLLNWDHLVDWLPKDFQHEIKSYMPVTKLKKMSAFWYMDDEVLKEICSHLRLMKFNRTDNIIDKGDPIQMLFIVEGRIGYGGWVKDAREIYGEELLVWPFSTSFPDKVPIAAESPLLITDVVEALVLTASDMESVATKFRKHFIKNYGKFLHTGAFPYYYYERDIKEVTRNYTCLKNPNEGGYGTVYHPELNGRAVAIKTCNSATGDPFIQSQRLVHEAFVLSEIDHKNVEKLLGCCLETRWPIMVYDRTDALTFVEHFHRNKSKLSLESRMKIAAETAGALAHMHSRSVIHRDVKTANILIGHKTHTVQVTGFGASRLLDEDEVSTLPGTSRYLDPEYLKSHDVYGFGVVLVELITRQEAISSNGSETSLANDFVRSVQEDRLGQILDGEINTDKYSFEMAKKVSELAVTCLRSRGEERPSMEKVAEELEGVVQAIINRVELLELPSEVLM